jgi:hypothetical protein
MPPSSPMAVASPPRAPISFLSVPAWMLHGPGMVAVSHVEAPWQRDGSGSRRVSPKAASSPTRHRPRGNKRSSTGMPASRRNQTWGLMGGAGPRGQQRCVPRGAVTMLFMKQLTRATRPWNKEISSRGKKLVMKEQNFS